MFINIINKGKILKYHVFNVQNQIYSNIQSYIQISKSGLETFFISIVRHLAVTFRDDKAKQAPNELIGGTLFFLN